VELDARGNEVHVTKWLSDWFSQTSVVSGDPTRRKMDDVHKACSDTGDELKREAQAKGWHVFKTDTHYVLIPAGKVEIVC
jgi:hypothetical protein